MISFNLVRAFRSEHWIYILILPQFLNVKHQENTQHIPVCFGNMSYRDGPTKSCGRLKYNIVRPLKSSFKLVTFKISHFRVAFDCFSKTSPGAQSYIWKWVWFAREWMCKKKSCPHERLCTKTCFETEVTATQKSLVS